MFILWLKFAIPLRTLSDHRPSRASTGEYFFIGD